MALKSLFIGIDRYKDNRIRDLAGARRDAVALWSLFQDSLPEMDAILLDDERATRTDVEKSLEVLLGQAEEDDSVNSDPSGTRILR